MLMALASGSAQAQRFATIGDYGWVGQPQADVSAMIRGWRPDFIITLGDNNYDYGAQNTIDPNIGQYYHDFIYPYVGSYGAGADINRFFPSLGNHDWRTAGAVPYLNYFVLPGNERYYQYRWGSVDFFVVDSDPNEPDGTSSNSVQAMWLQAALAQSTAPWRVVYFHHPPYSSGDHGDSAYMQWPFAQWGASAVLSGHDHTYERILRDGIPYFVNGLGGKSLYSFGNITQGSQFRYNQNYGAMLCDAGPDALTFSFYARTGALVDSYTLAAADSILPDSATLARGQAEGGRLEDLYTSNDAHFRARPGPVAWMQEAPMQLIVSGVSPIVAPSQLTFVLESGVDQPGMEQSISLFNFETGRYDELDTRVASQDDSVVEVVVQDRAERYVEAATGRVLARVGWKRVGPGFSLRWQARVDLGVWRLTP